MSHNGPSPFWPLLESTPSNSIVAEKRTLIAFLAEQPIEQVITALSQHHILSAPVVSSTDHTIVGSVDILSIAQYLIQHRGEEKQPIKQVCAPSSASSNEPIAPFYANNPLSLLVDLFATNVHRVALFTDACELVTPVSQTDVISFLAKNLEKTDEIKTFMNQSIETAFGSRNVKPVTVSQDTSVRDAIKTFITSGVSSVGIVDNSHHFIGSFAASDLRGLIDVKSLSQPIGQYVKAHGVAPIVVKADETLGNIIKVLAAKHQHRVWVIDANNHPVSVISQTDIMRIIGSGATVTARQANADIEPTRLWIAPPQTVKVDYAMLRGDETSGLAPSSSMQVSASTQTKIGGI